MRRRSTYRPPEPPPYDFRREPWPGSIAAIAGAGDRHELIKAATVTRPGEATVWRGYRLLVIAALGWLALGNAEQNRRQYQQNNQQHQAAKPSALPQQPYPEAADQPDQHCYGTTQPGLSCDAISAQAAIDQARDADKQAAAVWWQFGVGAFTLIAAVAAAIYARDAARASWRSVSVAKSIGQHQIKGRLRIGSPQVNIYSESTMSWLQLSLPITNIGDTPCYEVRAKPIIIEFMTDGCLVGRIEAAANLDPDISDLSPKDGQVRLFYRQSPFVPPEWYERVPDAVNGVMVRLTADISFVDVFGNSTRVVDAFEGPLRPNNFGDGPIPSFKSRIANADEMRRISRRTEHSEGAS